MLRIESGTTDQYAYFVAVDATDFTTRETGFSSFTVYRSRNGAAAAAMTTPTINETDATNMPGVYELLLDEDMTIGAGNVTEAMAFHITHAGMAPVTIEIELFSTANDSAISTIDTNVDSILADTGTDGVAISASTQNSIADTVWDESASDHVSAGSFGAALQVFESGTAQAGTGTTIQLQASGPSASDDFYNNCLVVLLSGTGAGQSRFITDYDGGTVTATVDTWITNPSTDTVYAILPFGTLPGASAPTAAQVADAVWDEVTADHTTSATFGEALGGSILRTETAQAGGASSITLDASASATNDIYNYNIIRVISGTGSGQSRQISDYNGSSKVATVSLAWTTQPSSDSVFQIIALGVDAATVGAIADGVWDEQRSGHVAAGSFGERVNANMTQVSGDTTAADNLESALDGTGGVTITAGITGDITGNLSGTIGSLGTTAKSDVNAEVDTALADINLDHLVSSAVDTDFATTVHLDSVVGQLADPGTTATFDRTTDSLEAIRNQGDSAWATATAVDLNADQSGVTVGTVNALGTQAKADVNAEVVDTLATDTYAEPGQGAPAATTTLAAKINYLYKAWRNRSTQTATTYSLYADDASTVDQKATVSDDATTYDRGEIATGP